MKTTCPLDGHWRDLEGRRLKCTVKDCKCSECREVLSEAEAQEWARE